MSEPSSPIDPRDLQVLRAAPPVPAEVRTRVRERVFGAIAAMDGRRTGGSDRVGAGTGALGAKKGMVIAFLVGGVVGSALHAAWTKPPPEKVVYVDRPAPVPLAPTDAPTSVPAGSAASPSAAPAGPPLPPSSGAPSRASQLAAERAILDEARKALAQGDPARSLERVEHHRRAFPSPLLAEERDAMWIQALVKASRYDEARSRGEAFRKRFPDSLFSSAVESALGSIP